jgi:hypothetical protein
MTQVAIVRAIGDGGYQEPRYGTYISSQRDTIVGYSDWVENLVNHDKVKLVEGPFEGSDYGEFANHVAKADGDEEKALGEYRKLLPAGNKNYEKVKVVESPADADAQEKEEKAAPKPAQKTAANKD